MIIQLIHLSFPDVFKNYSGEYKIYRDSYSIDLMGLEMRSIPIPLADAVQKIVLKEREICYKKPNDKEKKADLFITGSISAFKELSRRILSDVDEDLGYKIINVVKNYEEYDSLTYSIQNKRFAFNKAYVMGILNVTPDSFSDGGLFFNIDDAVQHGLSLLSDGADILDIGGESSRPGAQPVSAEEELERVIPVIEKIKAGKPDAVISIDTTKSRIADEALKKGASIVNDISGGTSDMAMFNIVKKHDAAIIIMHKKGSPETMQQNPYYINVISEIYDFLSGQAKSAKKAGIKNIFVDPGIGFGKRVEDNYEILRRLADFKCLGFPILTGVSRKSFIGKTLDQNTGDRDFSSAVVDAVAIKNGAKIIRTHNVSSGVQVCKLLNILS